MLKHVFVPALTSQMCAESRPSFGAIVVELEQMERQEQRKDVPVVLGERPMGQWGRNPKGILINKTSPEFPFGFFLDIPMFGYLVSPLKFEIYLSYLNIL